MAIQNGLAYQIKTCCSHKWGHKAKPLSSGHAPLRVQVHPIFATEKSYYTMITYLQDTSAWQISRDSSVTVQCDISHEFVIIY